MIDVAIAVLAVAAIVLEEVMAMRETGGKT